MRCYSPSISHSINFIHLFMKRYTFIFFAVITLATSCEKALLAPDTSATAVNTFEYLWHKVDEQYSMFDVKGVDWGMVYDTLRPQVHNGMSSDSLFAVCAAMLNTLHDGHVNLYSSYDVSRSDSIYYQFYTRSSIDIDVVVLNYLGINYHSAGGLAYNALCDGQVIYIRYGSFSSSFSLGQLRHVVESYPDAKGMIIDIRGNGGGSLANVDRWLQLMPSHGQVIYRSQLKSGPGHDDFAPLQETFAPVVDPAKAFNKPAYSPSPLRPTTIWRSSATPPPVDSACPVPASCPTAGATASLSTARWPLTTATTRMVSRPTSPSASMPKPHASLAATTLSIQHVH